MEKLNITQGEWKKHYFGENGNRQCRIHSDNVTIVKVLQIDEADANSDLITDAGTTYNDTPILPSELLKQRNELLEALKVLRSSVLCGNDIQTLANCQQAKEIINNIENANQK
jgi:hypothetical protein